MTNVVTLTRPNILRFTAVKEFEPEPEFGHHIVIARSEEGLAVMLMTPDTFEPIATYQDTPEGMSLAMFAANIADATLSVHTVLKPEDAA